MRRTCLVILPILLVLMSSAVLAQSNVIYLVRHADTPSDYEDNPDPDLIPAGKERAQDLAKVLRAAGITRIYSTNFVRTKATAEPLAQALGLDVEIYNPREAEELVERLKSHPGVHLVVGHSNTTPEMVGRLGGDPGQPIPHSEFDRLYVLVFGSPEGKPTTLHLRYGAQSEAH